MDHGGMDMGGSSSGVAACKISMLFNWYTIDACFLTEQWHVRSVGDFVGSLLGVFFMVVTLEAVRRIGRNYDRAIKRTYYAQEKLVAQQLIDKGEPGIVLPFRPTTTQHFVRSALYFVNYSTSFILMLLGMYFNIPLLFAIFLGGGVGYMLFARDTVSDEDTPMARGECCV
ncbi:hypothetical protein ACM66B_005007 [Microbotryomycetes sp. NB124-2]